MGQTKPEHAWFNEARYGMFIHWGPYAEHGRGEQVLMREMLDQRAYARQACRWNPARYDPKAWARHAKAAGFRYAVLTARHHDGYCLWRTDQTDYSSVAQAPQRDFVGEYVEAFRGEGLRVGLYYSWIDFRIPACYLGPVYDPRGWASFRHYCHAQVAELLTRYGKIDTLWFDGSWPATAEAWDSRRLVGRIRELQPHIMINNRLGYVGASLDYMGLKAASPPPNTTQEEDVGRSAFLGDFGTPEHKIIAEPRPWESCQVSTWRLWGYTAGERWRPAELLLDYLTDAAGQGGNLLLNVGPTGDGELPQAFVERTARIGEWLKVHGEAIRGSQSAAGLCEPVTWGRLTRVGNRLYAIVRFWPTCGFIRMAGLKADVRSAVLLTTGQPLTTRQEDKALVVEGLPAEAPTDLFGVIRLELACEPQSTGPYLPQLWRGDPRRFAPWAAQRGTSVWADGKER